MSDRNKLIVCIPSRQESDVLEENIKHHIEQGVDGFIITSHITIKENREVCDRYADFIIEVYEEKNKNFSQDLWRTRMAKRAYLANAQWVIPADTDEFWYGLQFLKKISISINSVICLNIWNHIPDITINDKQIFCRSDIPFYGTEQSKLAKVIHRSLKNTTIPYCSHRAINPGGKLINPVDIYMHHYPIRGWERFVLKAKTGKLVVPPITNTHKSGRSRWRQLLLQGGDEALREWYNDFLLTREKIVEGYYKGILDYFDPATPNYKPSKKEVAIQYDYSI